MNASKDNNIIRMCEVKSVEDSQAGLRIKARLIPEDNIITNDEDLPYAFPLLPKHVHINPKVGENVLIILSRQGETTSYRWFIGPVIPQQYDLDFSPFKYQSRALFNGLQYGQPLPNPNMNPENDGSYPDREWVGFQGRKNSDILFPPNEVRLRCGFQKEPNGPHKNRLLYNKADFAYIQMKYKKMKDEKNKEFYSAINIVADRINLLSHDSKEVYNLTDTKDMISDSEMSNILSTAHPLPYGDELVNFLEKLIDVIRTHTHSFPMNPPCFSSPQTDVLNTDLSKMLSQSIKIN